jgi:hypothetical protein
MASETEPQHHGEAANRASGPNPEKSACAFFERARLVHSRGFHAWLKQSAGHTQRANEHAHMSQDHANDIALTAHSRIWRWQAVSVPLLKHVFPHKSCQHISGEEGRRIRWRLACTKNAWRRDRRRRSVKFTVQTRANKSSDFTKMAAVEVRSRATARHTCTASYTPHKAER